MLCASILLRWRESLVALFCAAALVLISITSHAAEASPAHFTAIGAISDGLHLLTGGFLDRRPGVAGDAVRAPHRSGAAGGRHR